MAGQSDRRRPIDAEQALTGVTGHAPGHHRGLAVQLELDASLVAFGAALLSKSCDAAIEDAIAAGRAFAEAWERCHAGEARSEIDLSESPEVAD